MNTPTPSYKVYLAWHRDCTEARGHAEMLYQQLWGDPKQPLHRKGIGIPVEIRVFPDHSIPFESSCRSSTFVLIDSTMVNDREAWGPALDRWIEQCESLGDAHRVYPVALSDSAFKLSDSVGDFQHFRIYEDTDPAIRQGRLTRSVLLHVVVTWHLTGLPDKAAPKVKLFLSHAKEDGADIASLFRDWIHDDMMLDAFFDESDLTTGYRYASQLEDALRDEDCAVLAIGTDAYGSRPWCRKEVLIAKESGRPMVIVNALSKGEERSFPYQGNTPTVKWEDGEEASQIAPTVTLLLKEQLRQRFFNGHVDHLKSRDLLDKSVTVFCRPPELLTLQGRRDEVDASDAVIYPDPVLSDEEQEVLSASFKGLNLLTPHQHLDTLDRPNRPLEGKVIGISISESQDLEERGFLPDQLRTASLELARRLLGLGASLAYGGDLRQDGFTEDLIDLVRVYNRGSDHPSRLTNHSAWPLYVNIDPNWEARHIDELKIIRVEPPEDVQKRYGLDLSKFLPPDTLDNKYVWMRTLTKMREEMAEVVDARIVIGGKMTGYIGKLPGIVEEALLALEAKIPTFVLGIYGGAAGAVAEALQGESGESMTQAYQNQHGDYEAACDYYNEQAEKSGHKKIDYAAVTNTLASTGLGGCQTGVSVGELEQLATGRDFEALVGVILKGCLRQLPAN